MSTGSPPQRRGLVAAIVALAVSVVLVGIAACGVGGVLIYRATESAPVGEFVAANLNGNDTADTQRQQTDGIVLDNNAPTPAPQPREARKGGTATVVLPYNIPTFDPRVSYADNLGPINTALLYRSLTGFVNNPDGTQRLVGDLATDTGRSTDGGKTWTYTLRDGVKYADGSPITARDVSYGIARSFAPEATAGGPAVQNMLAGTHGAAGYLGRYAGPYASGQDTAPGVQVLDDKTVQFTLPTAQPSFPFAVAMLTTTPVPKAKDPGENPTQPAPESGPYMVQRLTEQEVVLVRNPAWDPKTDPIRTALPDRWELKTNVPSLMRDIATDGPMGKSALAISQSRSDPLAEFMTGADARTMSVTSVFSRYLVINTKRVTDVNVRKAVNLALNRKALAEGVAGPQYGLPATTVLSPVLPGYAKQDPFGGGVSGDRDKARKLLGNQRPRLTLVNTSALPIYQEAGEFIQESLENAGFDIELRTLSTLNEYLGATREPNNDIDMFIAAWGPDYSDADSVLTAMFAQSSFALGENLSQFSDAGIDEQLTTLRAESDRRKAAEGYRALDKKLLSEFAPIAPLWHAQNRIMFGSRIGGLDANRGRGVVRLENVFITA